MTDFSKFASIRNDNLDDLVKFITSCEFDVNIANDHGFTPLFIATIYQKQAIFDKLIELGADIHHTDKDGWSLLHVVAYNQRIEQFRELVSKGLDINHKNNRGKMPYQVSNASNLTTFRQLQQELGGNIDDSMDNVDNFNPVTSPFLSGTTDSSEVIETDKVTETPPDAKAASNSLEIPVATNKDGNHMALFVGQGTQKVGMMTEYLSISKVKELFNQAKDILRYDIWILFRMVLKRNLMIL